MYFKKNYFSKFFDYSFWRYQPFGRFFWKNHSCVTSVVGDISHHATHHWKALDEYIPNMYTFMGQKSVIFLINSLIIFTTLMKKYLNLILAKNIFWIPVFIQTKRFLFKCTSKKNCFSKFFEFSFSRYYPFRRFFWGKPFICNFCCR